MANSTSTWAGRVLSLLVVLFLLVDGATAFVAPQTLDAAMVETGFDPRQVTLIGGIAIVSALVYAVPRTAILGAILVTGFVGGAICTHLRIGEIGSPPQIICLVLGVAAWAGLWLRDPRLRALITGGD